VPVFQGIFHTQALTLQEFLAVTVLASVVFISVELKKLLRERASSTRTVAP